MQKHSINTLLVSFGCCLALDYIYRIILLSLEGCSGRDRNFRDFTPSIAGKISVPQS